jgi:hypothetical protein
MFFLRRCKPLSGELFIIQFKVCSMFPLSCNRVFSSAIDAYCGRGQLKLSGYYFPRRQLTLLQLVAGPSGWDEENGRWENGGPYTPILFLIFSPTKLAIEL